MGHPNTEGFDTVKDAETVLRNGVIYTMNPNQPQAQCVAMRQGRIAFVGDDQGAPIGAKTEVIDLQGRTVMPGFIDYHVHAHDGARSDLFETKLDAPESLEAFAAQIGAVCGGQAKGTWVRILLTSALVAKLLETDAARDYVSRASPDHPVMVNIMYHSAFVNERALEHMQLRAPYPEGVALGASGQPTGLLIEHAVALATQACRPFTPQQQIDAAKRSAEIFNSFGLTGFQHAVTSKAQLDAYKALDDADDLNLRVSACYATDTLIAPAHEGIGLEAAREHDCYRSDRLRADGVKFFMDGVVPLKSAAMLEPYVGGSDCGDLAFTAQELAAKIKPFDDMGFSVKVHAVGDRAIRETLDAYQIIRDANPDGAQFSIAHLSYIHADDIPRLKALNTVADLNPPMSYDSPAIALNRALLGDARAERAYPIKDILDAGTHCCIATDWPAMIPDPNPWFGIQTLITRANPVDPAYSTLGAEQALTLDEALPLYTRRPAEAMGWGDLTGTLEVGKSADMIMLSQNPYAVQPETLLQTRVLTTWFEGRKVYEDS